jgi:hypothetical protein
VVEFFPKAAERYRQKVADIHAALRRGEEGDPEAVALVRALIGRIVVHATPVPEPLGLEVEGTLAALMADTPEFQQSDRHDPGRSGSDCQVAGMAFVPTAGSLQRPAIVSRLM